MRIAFSEMYDEFRRIFRAVGFSDERAELCAELFTETALDGVQSHSVNRLDFFLEYIARGYVKIDAEPSLDHAAGPFERWNGNMGPGNLNAVFCTDRAVELACEHGIGCVAVRNTNHWMRGGTYGWRAADRDCIAFLCSNTIPNMPPWGSVSRRVGNNPMVIAVPRKEGHIVLDMAMSLFSYGKIQSHSLDKTPLPFDGGFDGDGNITSDAGQIMETGLPLPMGYWKGSGLAIMIDLLTAVLSGGDATHDLLGPRNVHGPSQMFMAFHLETLDSVSLAARIADEVVGFVHEATPVKPDGSVFYPGERTLAARRDNSENGIPVNPDIWRRITTLYR